MQRMICGLAALLLTPALSSAALVATLDFNDGGSDWTITTADGGIPLTFEPNKVRLGTSDPGTATGHYRLNQEIFAPAGFTMSNVILTGKISARNDAYYTDSRVGLESDPVTPTFVPFAADYHFSSYYDGGSSQFLDQPFTLDSTGNAEYTNLTSVHVAIELVKSIAAGGYWLPIDASDLQVFATLTPVPVPEPTSLAVLSLAGLAIARRRRRSV